MASDTRAASKPDRAGLRSELVELTASLVMGPFRPDEVLESAPADTYLTGILWPRGAPVDAFADDGGSNAGGGDDSSADASVPGYRAIRPCSIGLTFAVKTGSVIRVSLGSTSRYVPLEPLGKTNKSDEKQDRERSEKVVKGLDASKPSQRNWARIELGYSLLLPPSNNSFQKHFHKFIDRTGEDVVDTRLSVHVRRRVSLQQDVLTITLINEVQDSQDAGPRDSLCLFQAEIIVRVESDGRASIQPRKQSEIDISDEDALVNGLLYRDVREFAVGHGIAAVWSDELEGAVSEVRTAWMPTTVVHGTSADGHKSLDGFRSTHPDALSSAFLGQEDHRPSILSALTGFADCYDNWIATRLQSRIPLFEADLLTAAKINLGRCQSTVARIRAGVEILRTDSEAWAAFALANKAMNRQARFPAKGTNPKPLVWRPFQLAFMLLVIPSLVSPDDDSRDCMDLLWFPTGGGKTEAYLALTAFQIFYRRLTDASRRLHGGVDVLMRYTLRLLTVQQFQRAAALITACEFSRAEDSRLGKARISLGLYVGGEATPNNMGDAREALAKEHADEQPKSTPRQLLLCPVCGNKLRGIDYQADPVKPIVLITCSNGDCETAGRSLPVLSVDESIYTEPPSLLIGTIDKFAQIPKRTDIRRIFGLDDMGLPPGLIIQDELHLISGPLGSIAGLYETVIDALCTRDGYRPKVIGSTATIGQASAQVRALFDRRVLQFPPSGFDASDSFFAVRDEAGPDRVYVGMPTAGRSPKFALQAVIAALLQSASALIESGKWSDEDVDAYWTCVAYFNSLRELGGAYVLMQDDVPRQMQFLAGRLGVKRRELEDLPVELSSRRSSRELPELLNALAATLMHFNQDPFEYPEPKDMVLASNMISVGVDVPRLGLMVVNGQPKSTAEYIQASSRVGRGIPGLVVTLYNFGRPRDLSHFEHFRAYHSALYRSVEATSVTPWAPRARDKALHAVVASLVRHLVPGLSEDDGATQFDPNDQAVQSILASIKTRINAATDEEVAMDANDELQALVTNWEKRGQEARLSAKRLRYWIKKAPFGQTTPYLMYSAEDGAVTGSLAWATPNSMREVEPSTAFTLKTIPRRVERQ